MGEAFASLGWPSVTTWGVFVGVSCLAALGESWGHVVRAWRQRRLNRRLARNPYIQREEMNEYLFALGDELPPLHPPTVVRKGLLGGLLVACPLWFAQAHLEGWWEIGVRAIVGLGVLVSIWRWFNDPPETRARSGLAEITVSREAWLGLVGGVAIVALILLLVAAL